jgi:hypothetical protein
MHTDLPIGGQSWPREGYSGGYVAADLPRLKPRSSVFTCTKTRGMIFKPRVPHASKERGARIPGSALPLHLNQRLNLLPRP